MPQRLLRSARLLRYPFPRAPSGPIHILQRQYLQTAVESQAPVPDFAFAFDIDGVLLRSSKPIPGAAEALTTLKTHGIPFILLTNGGGKHEDMRVAEINSRLYVSLDPSLIVQSHTPFSELVDGTETQSRLKDKCVMVLGGDGDDCRKVAERYGFQQVVTPGDVFVAYPEIWPFSKNFLDYYKRFAQPLPRPIDTTNPSKSLKIDAIFVFNDPRDWALDAQIVIDILLSSQGVLGTISEKNGKKDLPNHGYQQDGQPPLYFSNPDLWWAAAYHAPRLGQGGFREALEGIWAAITGGLSQEVELKKIIVGKPYQFTYAFAEKRLAHVRSRMFKSSNLPPLRRVYMIGDNPESDICGANTYRSKFGSEWYSILVRTGVYRGGQPAWTPKATVENVQKAVEWALKSSHWPNSTPRPGPLSQS